jgi:hypothetical protein
MTRPMLVSAAAILSVLVSTLLWVPSPAQARTYHHAYPFHLPYEISWLHNYGPGPLPGSFAYYDGPSTNFCAQGAAAYIGQDHRRHPCL